MNSNTRRFHGPFYSRVLEHVNLCTAIFSSNSLRRSGSFWKLLLSRDFTQSAKRLFKPLKICSIGMNLFVKNHQTAHEAGLLLQQSDEAFSLASWSMFFCVWLKIYFLFVTIHNVSQSLSLCYWGSAYVSYCLTMDFHFILEANENFLCPHDACNITVFSGNPLHDQNDCSTVVIFILSYLLCSPLNILQICCSEHEALCLYLCSDGQMSVMGSVICKSSFLNFYHTVFR